jgi:hypothetical protein
MKPKVNTKVSAEGNRVNSPSTRQQLMKSSANGSAAADGRAMTLGTIWRLNTVEVNSVRCGSLDMPETMNVPARLSLSPRASHLFSKIDCVTVRKVASIALYCLSSR